MRHDKQSILLFTVLLPASCAAPPLEPMASVSWVPEEISAEDLVAEGAGQQAEAGQRFPLDLRTLLKLAGDKTLAVQMARTQAQAAAAEESRAFSKWLPTLRPRLSFYRHEGEIQDTGGAFFGVDKQNAFGGGAVDLSLDLADAYYQNISTAQRKRAALLGVRAARHLNVGEAVRLYYDLFETRASYAIAQAEEQYAEQLVFVEEERYRQGKGLKANVLRAKAFLAASKGQRALIQAKVTGANSELVALLLLPAAAELAPVEEAVMLIRFPEGEMTLPQLIGRAFNNRPDLKQSAALTEAAATDLTQARWAWLFPELRLTAAYGGFGKNLADTKDREDYFADAVWEWSFGRIAEARLADAHHREQVLKTESLGRQIVADLHVARANLVAARRTMTAAGQGVEAATAARALVAEHHKEGDALLVEVLDAERAKTRAAINLVRAVGSHNKAQFELRRLTGGE